MIVDLGLSDCLSCKGRGCAGCLDTGKAMPQELRLGVFLQRLGAGKATYHHGDIEYAGQLLVTQFEKLADLQKRLAEQEALNMELLFNPGP